MSHCRGWPQPPGAQHPSNLGGGAERAAAIYRGPGPPSLHMDWTGSIRAWDGNGWISISCRPAFWIVCGCGFPRIGPLTSIGCLPLTGPSVGHLIALDRWDKAFPFPSIPLIHSSNPSMLAPVLRVTTTEQPIITGCYSTYSLTPCLRLPRAA